MRLFYMCFNFDLFHDGFTIHYVHSPRAHHRSARALAGRRTHLYHVASSTHTAPPAAAQYVSRSAARHSV